jgi:hypothetical protein
MSPEQASDFSFFVAKIRHFAKNKKVPGNMVKGIFWEFF